MVGTATRDEARAARWAVRDYFLRAYEQEFGKRPIRHASDTRVVELLLKLADGNVREICRRIHRLMREPGVDASRASLATLFCRWTGP